MSVEALWVVSFGDTANGTQAPRNGGVVVLETGRVFGGDSAFAYSGNYILEGGNISGQAKIIRHNPDPEFTDVWNQGQDQFVINFCAQIAPNFDAIRGYMEAYGTSLPITFRRLAELPG